MGVDIATYRSRIGGSHQNSGRDVMYCTVYINFTSTVKWLCILTPLLLVLLLLISQNTLFGKRAFDLNIMDLPKSLAIFSGFHLCIADGTKANGLQYPGAVVFIGLLLIMAGIESNPGPLPKDDKTPKEDEMAAAVHSSMDDRQLPVNWRSKYNDVVSQQASHIREKLGLTDRFPEKISLRDVIKTSTRTKDTDDTGIHWTLLRELIMVNFEARDRCSYELYKQGQGQADDDSEDVESSDSNDSDEADKGKISNSLSEEFNINILKNHDIFITIFNCCDHGLKQVLIAKMYLCRLAVPLIYPTFQTNSICFSLWPFRNIPLDFKQKKQASLYLAKYPLKVVSFVRLGRPKFSKSVLLNAVISNQQNQHHHTFYNKDCLLGTHKREITNGLVEASWYIPGAQNNTVFNDVIMFTNLRGDAVNHKEQMLSLTGMSNCLVVTLDCGDVKIHLEKLKELQRQAASIILFLTGSKVKSVLKVCKQHLQEVKVITLFDKKEEKNIAALRMELQDDILALLQNSIDTDIETCAFQIQEYGIQVDEISLNCSLSKQVAVLVSKRLDDFCFTDVKKTLLPLQASWMDIAKHTKDLKRTDTSRLRFVDGDNCDATSTLWKKEPIKQEITKLRYEQSRLALKSYSLAYMIVQALAMNIDNMEYVSYFMEWIRFHVDERSHVVLPELANRYNISWGKYHETKQMSRQDNVQALEDEMRTTEQQLLDASLGLEHILREVGQLYESSRETMNQQISDSQKKLFEQLPDIAAKLLILGYPLELMDGDAVSLPNTWIRSVFDACIRLLGDKKVFIISILGVQSSGKSTLLNALFGLQFAVSAGRCTRGIYMQMLPVDSTPELPVDYVLVIDTEGLRAPELAFQQYDHDNELATLAVGIADMTIINIKGENTSEMKDILEIVIHALLRLKLANANLRFNTSCAFVHQNVSASNAASKMQHGRQKLVELLDVVTREAALEIGIKDIQMFRQVIQFDVNKDVWYVPDLWSGEPPMAHVNPGYSMTIASIKNAILDQMCYTADTARSLTSTIIHILDLWNGILSEDFVFNFRNNLEVKAYNSMESEYRKLTWQLQEFQMKWIVENRDTIGNPSSESEFERDYRERFEEVISKLEAFFDESSYKEELIKWKGAQLIAFRQFGEDLIKITKSEFYEIREEKKLHEKTKTMNVTHLAEIKDMAKSLAKSLEGQKPSDNDLEVYFNGMWSGWLQKLSPSEHTDAEPLVNRISSILFELRSQSRSQIGQEISRQNLYSPVNCLSAHADCLKCEYQKHLTIKPFLNHVQAVHIPNAIINIKHRLLNQDFKEKCQVKTIRFQQQLFSDIDLQINLDTNDSNIRFQDGHLVNLLNMIDSIIDEHNQNGDYDFNFLSPYRAMIMVYVSRYVLHVYTEVHRRYDEANSPRAIIQKYRSTTWSFFKNLVDEKTHDIIAATFVSEAIKSKLNETLHQHVAITIESRMRAHFSHSKYSLIVQIMDNLAADENFEMYKKYLLSPDTYALGWVKKVTYDRFNKSSEYSDIVTDYVGRCMREFKSDINEAGIKCKTQTGSKIETFISSLKKVSIPDHTANQMREYGLKDEDNFLSEMNIVLSDLENKFIEQHKETAFDNIEWKKSPYTCIYEGLWGCKDVCPICREPCQKMKEHTTCNEPHTCVQHRPGGVAGGHWQSNDKLLVESCAYLVQSQFHGQCPIFKYGCRKYSTCKSESPVFHPYKNYKTYLPDWDIAPSSDMESSKYWMWFIARFSKELAEWYRVETPDIPDSWHSINKEEARSSLRICYGY